VAADSSASVVVPILQALLRPSSVVDFGCGVGDWLAAFQRQGVEEVLGLDGDWVPLENLRIARTSFLRADFRQISALPRQFDLALCLEVLEHLEPRYCDRVLDVLASTSELVCFSAAIPGQGGHEHVNEQFQSYWVDAFRQRGFQAHDVVRPRVWADERISFWYRQNMLVFATDSASHRLGLTSEPFVADCVHPELYQRVLDPSNYSLSVVLTNIPSIAARWIGGRLRSVARSWK